MKDEDDMNDLPEEFQNVLISEPSVVSEEEFRAFLSEHVYDFDILDNKHAQVPSVMFYDPPENDR